MRVKGLAIDLTCGDGLVKAPPPRRKCRLSTLRLSGALAGFLRKHSRAIGEFGQRVCISLRPAFQPFRFEITAAYRRAQFSKDSVIRVVVPPAPFSAKPKRRPSGLVSGA